VTSVAARKRAKKASAKIARCEPRSKPSMIAHVPQAKTAYREKTGLEWLVHKRRLNTRQAMAGRHYGEDWRISQNHGAVPLRSCLNDTPGGSSAARSLPAVEYHLEALERLGAAQASLQYQSDMIAALALVCGQQLTPWQALGKDASARDIAKMEAVLMVALDLLDKHYRSAR
jgi:hypothetical protein